MKHLTMETKLQAIKDFHYVGVFLFTTGFLLFILG
jgi:hypothetical protein